ncbi:hypothetical protein JMUB6875_77100 [Nocardia sp. JMUB6875]|uniref:hypothetical protein n=1 Tax=Nocardia sp. JMUB6875 TaxID=3158170 RepID=UPI0032E6FD54
MSETREGKGGTILCAVIMMLLGVGLLFVCFSVIKETGTCAGETMRAGDRCQHVSRSKSHTNSVDEERSANHSTAWWTGGMGAVFVLGSGLVLGASLRSRSEPASVAVQGSSTTPSAPALTVSYTDGTEALAALARGESLTFGVLTLDATGLRSPKGDLTWSEVESVKVDQGAIVISKREKWWPLAFPVTKVPHAVLVVALSEHLRAASA